MKRKDFSEALENGTDHVKSGRTHSARGIEFESDIKDVLAAIESLIDLLALRLAPIKTRRGFGNLRSRGRRRRRLRDAANLFTKLVAGGRLDAGAVGAEHFAESVGSGEDHVNDGVLNFCGSVRIQSVFEFVSESAQFAEATGGGISF